MERETGFEPATPTLARLCSTTELFPLLIVWRDPIIPAPATLSTAARIGPWRGYGVRDARIFDGTTHASGYWRLTGASAWSASARVEKSPARTLYIPLSSST